MRGIFKVESPNQITVQLTLIMTLGEARAVRDYIEKTRTEIAEPHAAGEFRRQLIAVISAGERQFTSQSMHTERPDG